jgi:hypothetical protein
MKPFIRWCLIVLVIVGGAVYTAHSWLLDGIDGTIFAAVLPDDTVYAAQYTDAKFRQVAIGETQSAVLGTLGPPLDTGTHDGATLLRYARSRNDSNYRVRVIVIRHGHVSEKRHEFYVD